MLAELLEGVFGGGPGDWTLAVYEALGVDVPYVEAVGVVPDRDVSRRNYARKLLDHLFRGIGVQAPVQRVYFGFVRPFVAYAYNACALTLLDLGVRDVLFAGTPPPKEHGSGLDIPKKDAWDAWQCLLLIRHENLDVKML